MNWHGFITLVSETMHRFQTRISAWRANASVCWPSFPTFLGFQDLWPPIWLLNSQPWKRGEVSVQPALLKNGVERTQLSCGSDKKLPQAISSPWALCLTPQFWSLFTIDLFPLQAKGCILFFDFLLFGSPKQSIQVLSKLFPTVNLSVFTGEGTLSLTADLTGLFHTIIPCNHPIK